MENVITRLMRAHEVALEDVANDMGTEAAEDFGVYCDMAHSVVAMENPATDIAVEFYRRMGVSLHQYWAIENSKAFAAQTSPEEKRDTILADPGNAERLAKIRARRLRTRGQYSA